jgi:hypothetical protein
VIEKEKEEARIAKQQRKEQKKLIKMQEVEENQLLKRIASTHIGEIDDIIDVSMQAED